MRKVFSTFFGGLSLGATHITVTINRGPIIAAPASHAARLFLMWLLGLFLIW